jgi:hypothetical protein
VLPVVNFVRVCVLCHAGSSNQSNRQAPKRINAKEFENFKVDLFNKFKFVDWDNDDYIDIELH